MKILFLDVYKKSHSRISKDTAGGYGTENDLGDGIIGKALSFLIKRTVFWPNLSFIQLLQEFESRGHSCHYHKQVGSEIKFNCEYDMIFICSSIVCFETEIEAVNELQKKVSCPIFLCGSVAKHIQHKVPSNTQVLSGNYEFLLEYLELEGRSILSPFDNQFFTVPNGTPENLSYINWNRKDLPSNKNFILGARSNFFPFLSTRGCPYSCFEYCTYPTSQGRKVLHESEESIVEKFKKLCLDYKKPHVVFRDPVFSINLKKTKALLKKIGDSNLSMEFSAELHLNNIDDEFLELCKYANVKWLKFGIESAVPEVRDSVNRYSIENDEQKMIINKLRAANIKTVGMFILAQPEDTKATCEETINYACNLGLDIAQFSIFTPYPGTPHYLKVYDEMNFEKYQNINQFDLVYNHPILSKSHTRKLLEKAYIKFLLSKFKRIFTRLFS